MHLQLRDSLPQIITGAAIWTHNTVTVCTHNSVVVCVFKKFETSSRPDRTQVYTVSVKKCAEIVQVLFHSKILTVTEIQAYLHEWHRPVEMWWHTGGEVKGKLVNGVCSQYPSHYLRTLCFQH